MTITITITATAPLTNFLLIFTPHEHSKSMSSIPHAPTNTEPLHLVLEPRDARRVPRDVGARAAEAEGGHVEAAADVERVVGDVRADEVAAAPGARVAQGPPDAQRRQELRQVPAVGLQRLDVLPLLLRVQVEGLLGGLGLADRGPLGVQRCADLGADAVGEGGDCGGCCFYFGLWREAKLDRFGFEEEEEEEDHDGGEIKVRYQR